MKPTLLSAAALMAVAGVATSALAEKDLIIKQRTTSNQGTIPNQEETQYWTGKLRVSDSPSFRTIVDTGQQTVTSVDKTKKVYYVMTFNDMRAVHERAAAQRMALPAEMRVGMRLDEPVTLKPTGKTETIAGIETTEYTIEGSASTGSRVWMTDKIEVTPATKAWQRVVGPMNGVSDPTSQVGEALIKRDDLPMRMVIGTSLGERSITSATEIVEIKEQAPPPDMLKVPDGFTQVPSPFGASK
jgi:hypothetical protein